MSVSFQDNIKQWRERFDALQLRERNIILILALVVVAFLWDLLCFSPLQKTISDTKKEMAAVTSKMAALNNDVAAMTQAGKSSPTAQLNNEKRQLKQAIGELDRKIEQLTGNLIPAKKMVQVLEDVLQESSRLQLVSVKSLPVRRLATDEEKSQSTIADGEALYLHSVELVLRGSYFDTLAYLQALEKLPWQVIWDQLEYQVDRYPKADIKLRINTLSASSGLLGV